MEKINLEICCGTTCYMLGADKLLKIESELPEEWRDRVDVCAIPCLDQCMSENLCGAPFVKLNGEIIAHATPEIVLDAIRVLMNGKE